jgi:hypothetical protein
VTKQDFVDAVADRAIVVHADTIGCMVRDRSKGGISAAHDVNLCVAGPFERVLDQRSDILLIFNHEDPGHPTHRPTAYGVGVSPP